jgi:hypothetical protein
MLALQPDAVHDLPDTLPIPPVSRWRERRVEAASKRIARALAEISQELRKAT